MFYTCIWKWNIQHLFFLIGQIKDSTSNLEMPYLQTNPYSAKTAGNLCINGMLWGDTCTEHRRCLECRSQTTYILRKLSFFSPGCVSGSASSGCASARKSKNAQWKNAQRAAIDCNGPKRTYKKYWLVVWNIFYFSNILGIINHPNWLWYVSGG
jgi:hypothetical protein